MGQGFPIRQVLVVLLAIPSLALSFFVYHTGNALITLVLLVVACFGVYICPSLFARGHEILQPASLAFSSATRWPLFRASVPQETVFLVVRVGGPGQQLQRDFQRPFAPTHSPAQRKSPATICAW
jgi:hypothetical protein